VTEPSPERPSSPPPVRYKGEDLDPERGPGLGCFYLQMIVLGVLLVATPLSVSMSAPSIVSAVLLFLTIGILLVSGQTIIFLLRLVAADRREGRRRPIASRTRTVGELDDASVATALPEPNAADEEPAASALPATGAATLPEPSTADDAAGAGRHPGSGQVPPEPAPAPPSDEGPVRQ